MAKAISASRSARTTLRCFLPSQKKQMKSSPEQFRAWIPLKMAPPEVILPMLIPSPFSSVWTLARIPASQMEAPPANRGKMQTRTPAAHQTQNNRAITPGGQISTMQKISPGCHDMQAMFALPTVIPGAGSRKHPASRRKP